MRWIRIMPGLYRNEKSTIRISRQPHKPAEQRWRVTWKHMMGETSRYVRTLADAKTIPNRGH